MQAPVLTKNIYIILKRTAHSLMPMVCSQLPALPPPWPISLCSPDWPKHVIIPQSPEERDYRHALPRLAQVYF